MDAVGWKDGEQMILHLQSLKPDVVVVCVSILRTRKAVEFTRWRELLRCMKGIDIVWILAPDKVYGNGDIRLRTTFEQWLLKSDEASEVINHYYFSMVGGGFMVSPSILAQHLVDIAKACRANKNSKASGRAASFSNSFKTALSEF